jgi:hypothetical protein
MIAPLSQHLLQELRDVENSFVDDSDPSEREERLAAREFMSALVDQVVSQRQQLSHRETNKLNHWIGKLCARRKMASVSPALVDEVIQLLDSATRDSLDARYSEEMLEAVPLFVDRTLKLAVLVSNYPASEQTNLYIHEAARAYIYGLPLASVAMSRAAMEQSLRDRLGYQQSDERISFDDLVKKAQTYGLLPRERQNPVGPGIRTVNKRCNEVLHQGPVSDDEAFELLTAARSVIEELHSADGVS